jgi:endonuclease-3
MPEPMPEPLPFDGVDRTRGKTVRAPYILDALSAEHHDAKIALHYDSTWQLLAATMLSAQSTDVKVNEITPALFAELPDAEATAGSTVGRIEELIGSLGLFRQKAKNLHASAVIVLTEHGGVVPAAMESLIGLPGVARKTANVVLSNAFAINEGVVVDTHVQRLSRRLRLTTHDTAPKIEKDLMKLFPPSRWLDVADTLIFHGRRVCDARRPDCAGCVIKQLCPSDQTAGLKDKR